MTEGYDQDFGLEALDAQWESTAAADLRNLPDGVYTATILKCYMSRTKDGGKPSIRWEFGVALPAVLRGRKVFRTSVVNPEAFPWLKRDLAILGLKLTKISDLPYHCHDVLGKVVEIKVVTKGDRQNVYFNRLIANEASGMVDAAPDTGTPF
jgi:hypothetical protein